MSHIPILPKKDQPLNLFKRNKRACDLCKTKKIRCIVLGDTRPCKNCLFAKENCTFEFNLCIQGQHFSDLNETDSIMGNSPIQSKDMLRKINDHIKSIADIDKEISDKLLEVYFAHIHNHIPVVNKKLFLREYRGLLPNLPSSILLMAIYFVTAKYITISRFCDSSKIQKDCTFPKDLETVLEEKLLGYFASKYDPSISSLQAHLLTQLLYLDSRKWKYSRFRNFVVENKDGKGFLWTLQRKFQDLEPNTSDLRSFASKDEIQTKQRIWWFLYVIDYWMRMGSGKPCVILDEVKGAYKHKTLTAVKYCEEIYPLECADWNEVMDSMTLEDQNMPRFPSLDKESAEIYKDESMPVYRSFIQMIQLCKTLKSKSKDFDLLKPKHCFSESDYYSSINHIHLMPSDWKQNLEKVLKKKPFREANAQTKSPDLAMFTSDFLLLSYYALSILFNEPLEKKIRTESVLQHGSKNLVLECTDSVNHIVDLLQKIQCCDFILLSWAYAAYPIVISAAIYSLKLYGQREGQCEKSEQKLSRCIAVVNQVNMFSPTKNIVEGIFQKSPLSFNCPKLFKDQHESNKRKGKEKTDSEKQETSPLNKDYKWLNQLFTSSQKTLVQNSRSVPESNIGSQQHKDISFF
ncbi:hypothetical protein BY458DRAFT_582559 [Sporodiniella umbellata]|nr:hypothetical protein BY458DRAFT_582559 [Sporodiniella umbellata]